MDTKNLYPKSKGYWIIYRYYDAIGKPFCRLAYIGRYNYQDKEKIYVCYNPAYFHTWHNDYVRYEDILVSFRVTSFTEAEEYYCKLISAMHKKYPHLKELSPVVE